MPKTLDEQTAVVEKLDAFTSLIFKLQEERDLRQKQYEYYREKLLTFE
jgi:type I restriction enzyme S subunit